MSALRNFRFQKNKAMSPEGRMTSQSGASMDNGSSNGVSPEDSNDSIHPPTGKRPRLAAEMDSSSDRGKYPSNKNG